MCHVKQSRHKTFRQGTHRKAQTCALAPPVCSAVSAVGAIAAADAAVRRDLSEGPILEAFSNAIAKGPSCPAAGACAGVLRTLCGGGFDAGTARASVANTVAAASTAALVRLGAAGPLAALLSDGKGSEAGHAAGVLAAIAAVDLPCLEEAGAFEACADVLCNQQAHVLVKVDCAKVIAAGAALLPPAVADDKARSINGSMEAKATLWPRTRRSRSFGPACLPLCG